MFYNVIDEIQNKFKGLKGKIFLHYVDVDCLTEEEKENIKNSTKLFEPVSMLIIENNKLFKKKLILGFDGSGLEEYNIQKDIGIAGFQIDNRTYIFKRHFLDYDEMYNFILSKIKENHAELLI